MYQSRRRGGLRRERGLPLYIYPSHIDKIVQGIWPRKRGISPSLSTWQKSSALEASLHCFLRIRLSALLHIFRVESVQWDGSLETSSVGPSSAAQYYYLSETYLFASILWVCRKESSIPLFRQFAASKCVFLFFLSTV